MVIYLFDYDYIVNQIQEAAERYRTERESTNIDSYNRKISKIELRRQLREKKLQDKLEENRKNNKEKFMKQSEEQEKLKEKNLKMLDEYSKKIMEKDEKTRQVRQVLLFPKITNF